VGFFAYVKLATAYQNKSIRFSSAHRSSCTFDCWIWGTPQYALL